MGEVVLELTCAAEKDGDFLIFYVTPSRGLQANVSRLTLSYEKQGLFQG